MALCLFWNGMKEIIFRNQIFGVLRDLYGVSEIWILPFLVFIIGTGILAGTVDHLKANAKKQNREMADLNAMTSAERVKKDLTKGYVKTDSGQ